MADADEHCAFSLHKIKVWTTINSMCALTLDYHTTTIRPTRESDASAILKMVETSWRIHIRVAWSSLRHRLRTMPGMVAQDHAGLRGFFIIDPHPSELAMIAAAGLRDTWGVRPYLATLLPPIEQLARDHDLASLVYMGYEQWLIDGLQEQGFEARNWIVTFERLNREVLPGASSSAGLRTAHRNDLAAMLGLDALAFEPMWRKSASYFQEALAHAGSFVVAEIDGQIVGYEWCEVYQQRAHLTRLAVHPAYQGQGVGSQLLRQAIIDATTLGADLLTLNTQQHNRRSHALYTRFGFVNTHQHVPVLWKELT